MIRAYRDRREGNAMKYRCEKCGAEVKTELGLAGHELVCEKCGGAQRYVGFGRANGCVVLVGLFATMTVAIWYLSDVAGRRAALTWGGILALTGLLWIGITLDAILAELRRRKK